MTSRMSLTATANLGLIALIASGAISVFACQQRDSSGEKGAGFAVSGSPDCLPDITLVDQHGQKVAFSSLKGKPALIDFIYTSCPGECLALTQRLKLIATRLGPALGTKVRIVSITVDPERDGPDQLLTYANQQGTNLNGWVYLTGTPMQIEDVMRRFKLIRRREADGTVDHVLEVFLVDANGHVLLQYLGDNINPARAVTNIDAAAAGRVVTGGEGSVAWLPAKE